MFGYFNEWGKLWYPDHLVDEPRFLIPLALICLFSILWITCAGGYKRGIIPNIFVFLIFLWSFPALVAGIVALVMLIIKILLAIFLVAVVISGLSSEVFSEPDYTVKRKDKDTWEIKKK